MLKALWFFIKAAVLIGVVLWVAERPGQVQIEWMDYDVTVQMGLFLASLIFVILLSIFIYQVIKTFFQLPASFRYYNHVKGREKGYHALTLGLTAVAAGDTQTAIREAKKAKKFLSDDDGLPLLLEAQAARLDGREEDAHESFVALLENKDAAFLGLRGLLQSSMDHSDYAEALRLAKQGLALHPKQPWILKIVYDLHIRQRQWTDARDILKRAEKAGAVEKEKARSDRVAMALALALEAEAEGLHEVAQDQFRKAKRLDSSFVPTVILHAGYLIRQKQDKKALSMIERAWKSSPHPALLRMWEDLTPAKHDKDSLSRLRWFEKLLAINPDSAAAQIAAGKAAMEGGLWGEARSYFVRAEEIRPSAALYKVFASLEERSTGNYEGARQWIEKAADAPADNAWVCRDTGIVYDQWVPVAQPHGSFNTIEWTVPNGAGGQDGLVRLSSDVDASLIDAPRVA